MKDCSACNKLGDEFHYLFEWKKLKEERKLFLGKKLQAGANTEDYYRLFSTCNYKKLCKVAGFVCSIMKEFR